jgi:hypothetical protein
VISGGFGLFYDNPPAGMVDDLLANPPVSVAIRVRPPTGTLPFDPGTNGSVYTWNQSAQAFNAGFASNQTYTQIAASLAATWGEFRSSRFHSSHGDHSRPDLAGVEPAVPAAN